MIRAVIFDFDGTVSNRQENVYRVFADYLRPFFSDFSDIEYEAVLQDLMIYDCNGTLDVEVRVVPFIRKYGKYLPDDFTEKFKPYYYDNMYAYTVLKDETIEVLEKLRKDHKLGLLSNGHSGSQHAKIDAMDIEKYFDKVLVSGDLGVHKPDPKIFEMMAEALGVRCDECLMVGDIFSIDILGAVRAGMKSAWFITDFEKPSFYYHGYRINDLRQIFDILDKENGKS